MKNLNNTQKTVSKKVELLNNFKTAFDNEQRSLSSLVRWINSDNGLKQFDKFIIPLFALYEDSEAKILKPSQITTKFLKTYNHANVFYKVDNDLNIIDKRLFEFTAVKNAIRNYINNKPFNHDSDLITMVASKKQAIELRKQLEAQNIA